MTRGDLRHASLAPGIAAFLACALAIGITLLTFAQYQALSRTLRSAWEAREDAAAVNLALMVQPLLEHGKSGALTYAVSRASAERSVAVLDADGRVVAASPGAEAAGTAVSDPRWQAALASSGPVVWLDQAGSVRLRRALIRFHAGSEGPSTGALLISADLARLEKQTADNLAELLAVNGGITVALLCLVGFAGWMGRGAGRAPRGGDQAALSDEEAGSSRSTVPPMGPSPLTQAALDALPANVCVLDHDGTIVAVNRAWVEFARENGNPLQYDTGVGVNYLEICRRTHGTSAPDARKALVGIQSVLDHTVSQFTLEYACEDPPPGRRFLLSATPLPEGGAVLAHLDVSYVRRSEDDMEAEPDGPPPFDRFLATVPIGVIQLTRDLTVRRMSRTMAEWLGLAQEESAGRNLRELLSPERWAVLRPVLEQVLVNGKPVYGLDEQVPIASQPGRMRHLRSDFYLDRTDDGATLYGISLDLTQEKLTDLERDERFRELEARIRELDQMAIRDALTGLYNRRFFDEALDQEWRRFQRAGEPFTVVIMDVDAFKRINDRFGHEAGDKALQQVGQTLRDTLRESDLVARVGGDEFAALLPGADTGHSEMVVEKLRQTLRRVRLPGDQGAISLTISLGHATVPGFPPVTSAAELLRVADKRMYDAKRLGSSRKSHAR